MKTKSSKKVCFYLGFICFLIKLSTCNAKDSFTQIAPNLLNLNQCTPYAFGDFNADKLIDIFCVSNSGKQIEIWLAQDSFKDSLFVKYKTLALNDTNIVNLIPGDFNGDSVIDLLVVYSTDSTSYLSIRLYIGNKVAKDQNDISDSGSFVRQFQFEFKDQPLATDLNGDGILDLVGEDQNGRQYYYFNEQGAVTTKKQSGSLNSLLVGFANAVVDLNNDYLPDLVLTSDSGNGKPSYEVWTRDESGEYKNIKSYPPPNDAVKFGQSLFADFDSDGSFEHLLPVCKDSDCKNSTIFIYKNDQWIELPVEFNEFIFQSEKVNEFGLNNIGLSLRSGDYNLDGFADLVVVMKEARSTDQNNRFAIVLMNSPCNDATKCNSLFSRTFKRDLSINKMFQVNNVYLTTFFDINDDGSLDVLLLVKNSEDTSFHLLAFKNELYDDVYFLKVMVVPGRCDKNCPYSVLPYGMNYPTPFIKIETESFEYKTFKLYASQLSQSSHLSLQLPYVIFGLGSTPNFVDRLTVGIEANIKGSSMVESRHKDWTSIIPNSQLVISVSPREYTQYWKMQLFLTPSKNILFTGITLASTMVCLIVVIIFLQFREKKIDEKERKLESQRFHFDGL